MTSTSAMSPSLISQQAGAIAPTADPAPTIRHERHTAGGADRIEALCFLGLTVALAVLTVSGEYTHFTTPRTLPYLIIAIVLLAALSVCAWTGIFHATPRSAGRMLVALAVPALLIAIPAQASTSTSGFDKYAGGRAIAINYSSESSRSSGKSKSHGLKGLDEADKTITIANDDFGSWFEVIDHDPQQYVGYTVKLTGFVSTPSTLGSRQFLISRQLMSCCILDMTPFGFTATYGGGKQLKQYEWLNITGTLAMGTIGESGYSHQGLVLQVNDVSAVDSATTPVGYFYRQ